MNINTLSRRSTLGLVGSAAAALMTSCREQKAPAAQPAAEPAAQEDERAVADRARRMKWWIEARFGMFIHWGAFSVLKRDVWNMEMEAIPVAEYKQEVGPQFKPPVGAPRAWAKLARQAGQKYMVMTSKNHDGYCNFDTQTTNFCSTKQACGRDLVREFLEAAHAEGLRAGVYFSMMDWSHPDYIRCALDEAARKRFVEYIHTQVRELCSNYGKLDILWYDGAWPLDPEQWEAEKLSKMVFQLQPDIIVNDRGGPLPGDFSTPEGKIVPATEGRAWETCMTINGAWGYFKGDENWKSTPDILRNLITCARGGGNYLLDIGPRQDGSVPEGAVKVLTEVGKWMSEYGQTIYGTERCDVVRSMYLDCTRKGNTMYMHIYRWVGSTLILARLKSKVKSARWFATGKPVEFIQAQELDPFEPPLPFPIYRVKFVGLPESAPDEIMPVIVAEFEGIPEQDLKFSRYGPKNKKS